MARCMLMMGILFLALVFCISPGWGQESSDYTDYGSRDHQSGNFSDGSVEETPFVSNRPIWLSLKDLTPEERDNSNISIQLEHNASPAAIEMSKQIEILWNGGGYETALDMFDDLAGITGAQEINIGVAWKEPVAGSAEKWGTDVRIGTRDSVYVAALDVHHGTGNIFVVYLYEGDGKQNSWELQMSTNGGQTWLSLYNWWAVYDLPDVDVAVVGDYCFVGYIRSPTQTNIQVMRFDVNTGDLVKFSDGYDYDDVATVLDTLAFQEIDIETNEDFGPAYTGMVYVATINYNRDLRVYWDDVDGQSWSEVRVIHNDADRGLDMCLNDASADYWLLVSYINYKDSLKIYGTHGSGWAKLLATPTNESYTDYSSIAAYRDTIHCFYEYGGSHKYVRYQVSYNGGDSWLWGMVHDTVAVSECPAVASRGGGGVAAIYRYYSSPRTGRFMWRDYFGYPWDDFATYSDFAPYYNQPDIEHLGGGKYGIVYTSWTDPVYHGLYFDNGSGCCQTAGDANGDGVVNVGDAVYVINYVFKGGAAPPCISEGDANGDGVVNVGDAVYVVNYVFKGGSSPVCP